MKQLFLLCLVFTMILSCKQKAAEEEEQVPTEPALSADLQHYEDEVMKIHDEVMPKMSEIQRLISQLNGIKAKAGENSEGTPVMIEGLDDALNSLREAEQGMMDWMKNYSDRKTKVTGDLQRVFYERELEKITQVKDNMLNSIEKANSWIAQYQGPK